MRRGRPSASQPRRIRDCLASGIAENGHPVGLAGYPAPAQGHDAGCAGATTARGGARYIWPGRMRLGFRATTGAEVQAARLQNANFLGPDGGIGAEGLKRRISGEIARVRPLGGGIYRGKKLLPPGVQQKIDYFATLLLFRANLCVPYDNVLPSKSRFKMILIFVPYISPPSSP